MDFDPCPFAWQELENCGEPDANNVPRPQRFSLLFFGFSRNACLPQNGATYQVM